MHWRPRVDDVCRLHHRHAACRSRHAAADRGLAHQAQFAVPDLPTVDEAGIKGFNLDAWAGLVAPTGTPPEVVAKLNAALRPIIDSPAVQTKFKNVGFEDFFDPQELGDFIKAQLVEWQKMIKDAGIQSD